MIHLFRQALAFQEWLEQHECRFCYIGGIALQHWGEPRVTRDIDVSIFTGFSGEEGIVDALLAAHSPRIADAREFALRHRVLLLTTAGGVEVDVALAALPFERDMIDRSVRAEFQPDVQLRICNAEDLFVLKAFADRPQDRADLLGIARRRGGQLAWDAIIERLTPFAAAKEDPGILANAASLQKEFG